MKRTFEATPRLQLPRVRWVKLLTKTALWASAEFTLGLVGADTLADYSEFLNQHQTLVQVAEAFSNLSTLI